MRGRLLRWIEHFLIGRRQRVRVAESCSAWNPVISGIPQGSVLGPILFVCYINDMPETIVSIIQMYADDTKLFRKIDGEIDRRALQDDLDRLVLWAKKWQLKFNVEKCKVMHIGRNSQMQYDMERADSVQREILQVTDEEKDLGVWFDSTLKPANHIAHVVNKANQLLGLVRRTFTYMDAELMKLIFTSKIRPHLEYSNVVWHPYLKKDIDLIEAVQHRATRMIPGFSKISYEERLKKLDMPTLFYRRLRGDAIEAYKYLHNIYAVNGKELLPLHVPKGLQTRGHSLTAQLES